MPFSVIRPSPPPSVDRSTLPPTSTDPAAPPTPLPPASDRPRGKEEPCNSERPTRRSEADDTCPTPFAIPPAPKPLTWVNFPADPTDD